MSIIAAIQDVPGYWGPSGQHHVINRAPLEVWVTVQPDYMVRDGAYPYTVVAWLGDSDSPFAYRVGAHTLKGLDAFIDQLCKEAS